MRSKITTSMALAQKVIPFNPGLAKADYEVITRDGRPVRILCYDTIDPPRPITGLIYDKELGREYTCSWTLLGRHFPRQTNDSDLFLVEP